MKTTKQLWLKTLSMVLTLALLISCVPNQVFAMAGETLMSAINADDTVTLQTEQELLGTEHIVEEDTSKRGESYKEYILNNGLRLATVYPAAIHYEDEGEWKDIDNTLIATLSGGSTFYTNTAGMWNVRFPQSLSGSNMIGITKDGFTIQFGMAGELRSTGDVVVASVGQIGSENTAATLAVSAAQTSTAQIQQLDLTAARAEAEYPETVLDTLNSRLIYANIYPNTNVVYDLQGNQLKESIILQQYDSTLWGYRYTLDTGNLVPVMNEDQQIDLCNPETNEVVLTMPAPYMLDSNGEYSYDVDVSLVRNGSNYLLSYYLPREWLADAERAWPVILDPIVSADGSYSNMRDRTIGELRDEAYNLGSIRCGYSETYGKLRFFMKYVDLPKLTSADVIVDATISLRKIETGSTTAVVEVHKVKNDVAWDSETITWSNQPSYNDTIEDYAVCQAEGRYTWSITDIVRYWYAVENTGMMFKVSDETEAAQIPNWKQFYSSDFDSVTAEYMPLLNIKFRNANGLEDYWDYTASSAGRAGTGYVNNYNGNLVWIHSDIGFGGNRMPVAISHVYNANDSANNTFGMGFGWRTNYNQRVYQWTQNTNYYVWEDSDGTRHYFYKTSAGTYLDEDGLYLTLTTHGTGTSTTYQITDQYGNKSYFDTDGRLVKIENNQQTKSNISITYENGLIKTITDGANRVYEFTYTNNLLTQISYKGGGTSTVSYVNFAYTSNRLTSITYKDGKKVTYTYGSKNLLLSAQDIDGYKLEYTYNLIDTTALIQPSRVATITESDGTQGSWISIEYANNQTTFTDHNNNKQIIQFNNWGNPVAIMDGEGRGQFVSYKPTPNNTDKGNQLELSSKLQNTVSNLLADGSFERGTLWTATSTAVTRTLVTGTAYYGSRSLKMTRASAGTAGGVYKTITAVAGETYTFSAYVKTDSTANAYLAIVDISGNMAVSQKLDSNSNWTRLEVSLTATSSGQMKVQLLTETAGTVYMDCVQLERTPTASRYNLIDNGDFQSNQYWAISAGSSTNIQRTTKPTLQSTDLPIPHLDNYAYKFTGNPQGQLQLKQHVTVSGSKDDVFVLTGWAKGDSAPLTDANRKFSLRGVFTYSDGSTSEPFDFSFNPDADSAVNWQYTAGVMVAPAAYTGIDIYLVYDYNVNTVWFDGIQLYKEEFGYSYTYDSNGNITAVKDIQGQSTCYNYDVNQDLTSMELPTGAITSYTHDDYHNVLTATTDTGVVYTYTYDDYGNNTSVSIGTGTNKITSTAEYTDDGNLLERTIDTLGNITQYGYNVQTSVLEWVQYPEDTANTRTNYTYDNMYRITNADVSTNSGCDLSVSYTYTNDLLTELETASTTYTFEYGAFGLRTGLYIRQRELATYTYTNDQNHYLSSLDYGNGDSVEYTYDKLGRVTCQTYEDGDTITYAYDNNGALATVTDSATGRKTTYYYDLTNRLIMYVETDNNGYSHGIGYGYDTINNLTTMVEIINGVEYTTSYTYDDDNRIRQTSVNANQNTISNTYTYDSYGRIAWIDLTDGICDGISKEYRYRTLTGSKPTMQVEELQMDVGDYIVGFTYSYDDNGNIASVAYGNYTITYEYDSQNQLIRENNGQIGKTYKWYYDNAGNILKREEYAYTTETLGTAVDTVNYTYSDSNWGDLLTAYDGVTIDRDELGNPTDDGTWDYTWEHGRQLASMANSTTTWSFTYDANGLRTSRTNGTATYSYVYNGNQLVQMKKGNDTLYFIYDVTGAPTVVMYNGVPYYYITNQQRDALLLVDSEDNIVVEYAIDSWGNIYSVSGSMATTLGTLNPLIYRGYVYDYETEMYYLQNRYYSPKLGRFINADALTSTGQGLLGYNMFAYCANNPVNAIDPTGTGFVGLGAQFELTIGSYSFGIEVIVYWDETVCNGGGPIVALYCYEGAAFSVSADLMKSESLTGVIEQLTLAITTNVAEGWDAAALASLQALLFGVSGSGSVLAIWGYDNFDSTDDYAGPFTSYSGGACHAKLTYSYSDTCWTIAFGATTAKGWAFSIGQTNYIEITPDAWKNNSVPTNTLGGATGGGGGASFAKVSTVHFFYICIY